MGIVGSTTDLLGFGNESPRRGKVFSQGGPGRGAWRGRGKQRQRAGRAGVAFAGLCPREGSAPFPHSHLQGQDAVVPHKRLAVTTSFRSLSGFPATIKGHVCRGEDSGGGQWPWRRDGVGSQAQREGEGRGRGGGRQGASRTRDLCGSLGVPGSLVAGSSEQRRWLRAQLGEAERRGDPTSWGQSETQERRPLAKPTEARARRRAEAEQGARRTSRRGGPGLEATRPPRPASEAAVRFPGPPAFSPIYLPPADFPVLQHTCGLWPQIPNESLPLKAKKKKILMKEYTLICYLRSSSYWAEPGQPSPLFSAF